MPRQLSRRSLLGVAAGAATGLLGRAAAQRYSFAPQIEFAADGMSVTVEGDDAESVTLTTDDGSTFSYDGSATRYGYTKASEDPIEGWHGTIEQVEVSDGSETVVRLNPHYRTDLEVGCSTFRTEADVADLRLDFEHATKQYDPPTGDAARHGSPGRALREIVKKDNEMQITRPEDCSPPDERGVVFECTSVTVRPEEFVNGVEACYGVELTFADGTSQRVGERGEAFEPPVTFEGSGEHAGKVIESLGFSYDEYGAGWFHYENPDAGGCEPATASAESESVEEDDASDADDGDGADGESGTDDAETTADADGSDAEPTGDADAETVEDGDSEPAADDGASTESDDSGATGDRDADADGGGESADGSDEDAAADGSDGGTDADGGDAEDGADEPASTSSDGDGGSEDADGGSEDTDSGSEDADSGGETDEQSSDDGGEDEEFDWRDLNDEW